jgi:hypothetical protein
VKLSVFPTSEHWGTGDWATVFTGGVARDVMWCESVPAAPYAWTPRPQDVAAVIAFWATSNRGSNDDGPGSEQEMVALVRLCSGRWASVAAGNDYTGWGCQGDYVRWRVATDRADVVRNGLSAGERRSLERVMRWSEVGDEHS